MAPRGLSRHLLLPVAALLLAGVGILSTHLPDERAVPTRASPDASAALPGDSSNGAKPPAPAVEDRSAREANLVTVGDAENPEPNDPGVSEVDRPEQLVLPAPGAAVPPPVPGYAIRGRVLSVEGPIREEPGQWPRTLVVQVSAPGCSRQCPLDGEGGFECMGLDAGTYVVSVRSSPPYGGLLCESVQVALGPSSPLAEPVFVLGGEVPVAVTVLERDSLAPMYKNVVVALSANGLDEVTARTDDQGGCVLNLIPGQYWINSYPPDDRSQGVDPQLVVVEPASQGLSVQLLVPAPGPRRLRGVLVDSQGNPVKGYVDIEFIAPDPNRQPADTFTVLDPGRRTFDDLLGYAYDLSGQLARRFVCTEDAWRDGMTIVLEPKARIVGRLLGPDGDPVSGARLDVQLLVSADRWRAEDRSLYTARAGSGGAFRMEGVPIGLDVQIAASAGDYRGDSGPLPLRSGGVYNVGDIVLKAREGPASRGIVRGRIVDERKRPLAEPVVWVSLEGRWARATVDQGWFLVSGVPTGRPVTITAVVPGLGSGSQTTVGGNRNCVFQIDTKGWGLLGSEAPPLVVDQWINHVPMTWEQLRGRVVLLAFQGYRDDRNVPALRSLCREYQPRGLTVITVFGHVPDDGSSEPQRVVGAILGLFQGAPIAGCLDADPGLIADLTPKDAPGSAFAGVTHSLYEVYMPPAMFLIDKRGRVRCSADPDTLEERIDMLLQE